MEAARRAQIVTIVNRANTEEELGELVSAELCDTFVAEIAFVLACHGDGGLAVVGAYGLRPEEVRRLPALGLLDASLTSPPRAAGADLLGVGARALVCAPFDAGPARGIVGVARLHDPDFDEAETALLEAVAVSVAHALERLRLAHERDRLYQEAQERAQAARVIGSIADGVLLIDNTGIVQLWNPAAEAITGLAQEIVVGRPVQEAIPGWSAIADALVVARGPASARGRATTVPLELAGRELWLSIKGVGFAEGTVFAFHDLTEERRLDQLKADFIATVSHELRTPLAAVHGAAKTLQREDIVVSSDVFRQLLTLIAEQSERLSAMVDDILLASRVDSPELKIATERVDVAELVVDVIAAAQAQTHERLMIELVTPRSPPAAADRDKLRQVLTNLVANAVKYSPAGGRIEIELEANDRHLAIVVRDEGLGIATSDQSLIFEKFYRADANMNLGVSGTGLGLYISRELVRRMGGTISVESQFGEGSIFVVTLPLADAQAAAV